MNKEKKIEIMANIVATLVAPHAHTGSIDTVCDQQQAIRKAWFILNETIESIEEEESSDTKKDFVDLDSE